MFKVRAKRSLGFVLAGLLALSVIAMTPSASEASIIVDFATTQTAGEHGPTYTDASGVVATGFYFNEGGNVWAMANLYVRNDDDDHGLGICNPDESVDCPGPTNHGDFNEVDNAGEEELLQLALPDGYRWISVQLSSVDDNDGSDDHIERGRLLSSASDDPGAIAGDNLWEFDDSMGTEPSFLIPGSAASAPYLYFQPVDWMFESNTNNDFLVYKVEIERVQMPEPTSMSLLAMGLLALGLSRRRQS